MLAPRDRSGLSVELDPLTFSHPIDIPEHYQDDLFAVLPTLAQVALAARPAELANEDLTAHSAIPVTEPDHPFFRAFRQTAVHHFDVIVFGSTHQPVTSVLRLHDAERNGRIIELHQSRTLSGDDSIFTVSDNEVPEKDRANPERFEVMSPAISGAEVVDWLKQEVQHGDQDRAYTTTDPHDLYPILEFSAKRADLVRAGAVALPSGVMLHVQEESQHRDLLCPTPSVLTRSVWLSADFPNVFEGIDIRQRAIVVSQIAGSRRTLNARFEIESNCPPEFVLPLGEVVTSSVLNEAADPEAFSQRFVAAYQALAEHQPQTTEQI